MPKRERVKLSAKEWSKKQEDPFGGDTMTLPEGADLFRIDKCLDKNNCIKIDIVPYTVGKGNPNAKPGDTHFERVFYVHRVPTPDGKSKALPCLAKNFEKPCPVCEYRQTVMHDKKLADDLFPKKRQLFNVIDRSEGGDPEKVLVLEYSYHLFGKQLKTEVDAADEEEEHIIFFPDPECGSTIKVKFSEESMGTNKFFKVAAIKFYPREEPLSEDVLGSAFCLDEIPKCLPYDKLKAMLDGGDDDEVDDEENDPPKNKPGKKADADDDPEPAKPNKNKPAKAPEPEPEPETEDWELGDDVEFDYKGDTCVGELVRIDKKTGLLHVEVTSGDGAREKPYVIEPADGRRPAEPEEEEEPEPVKAKPKAKPAATKKPAKDDAFEEDEEPKTKPGKKPAGKVAAKKPADDDDWDD